MKIDRSSTECRADTRDELRRAHSDVLQYKIYFDCGEFGWIHIVRAATWYIVVEVHCRCVHKSQHMYYSAHISFSYVFVYLLQTGKWKQQQSNTIQAKFLYLVFFRCCCCCCRCSLSFPFQAHLWLLSLRMQFCSRCCCYVDRCCYLNVFVYLFFIFPLLILSCSLVRHQLFPLCTTTVLARARRLLQFHDKFNEPMMAMCVCLAKWWTVSNTKHPVFCCATYTRNIYSIFSLVRTSNECSRAFATIHGWMTVINSPNEKDAKSESQEIFDSLVMLSMEKKANCLHEINAMIRCARATISLSCPTENRTNFIFFGVELLQCATIFFSSLF